MCTSTETPVATHTGHSGDHTDTQVDTDNPPPLNASREEWLEYAAALAEQHGIPGDVILELISSKGAPNFGGSIPASDGTGERLYGPLLVHGGLLEGGVFAEQVGHALYNKDGRPLTPADLQNNPAAGLLAGIEHLEQLVEMYDGDLQQAINHYQTGDPDNNDHDLGVSTASEEDEQCCSSAHAPDTSHSTGSMPATAARRAGPSALSGTTNPHGASGTGTTLPYTGRSAGPLSGDIPSGNGSSDPNDHVGGPDHGHGYLLNADAHNAAMAKVFGRAPADVIAYLIASLERLGAYNPGQNEQQKLSGAYLAANLMLKYSMAPPSLFANETEAGKFYGQAKLLAMNGDANGLREWIESRGGNTFGLGDQELIRVWGTNEHNNLHAILFGNRELANAVHMTSLNDNDGHEKDGMNPGMSGGYNNKGEYPQWGWFEGLQKVGGWFPQLKPAALQQAA